MATAVETYPWPKYLELWPVYQRLPWGPDDVPAPTIVRESDAVFQAWGPAPGNITPSWTYVSTPRINSGKFVVNPGGWFDPGDHPNCEPYFILKGTLHLSNPDTSDVVELRAGDAAVIPAWANHHGFNVGEEDCVIYWWVPREMHTDVFKQKVQDGTLHELGWYEREPVMYNGTHDRNAGFESRLDQLASWPSDAPKSDVDMVRLDRSRWLHLMQGDTYAEACLVSFFYADDAIRCGQLRLPRNRTTQTESGPWEKVIYVLDGQLALNYAGSSDTLLAQPGDVIVVPANTEHSFVAVGEVGATAIFGMARG